MLVFLNLNLAFKSIDNLVDAGLRLGLHEKFRRRHGHPLSASCALNLCPVTTGNCHNFYNKTSSSNLSLYGKMAAITNMKIEQNYSKDIFNESISQNLQPIRNNERNIKYHWIIFTMSIIFIQTTLQPKVESPFCYFFDPVSQSLNYFKNSIPISQMI